MCKHMVYLQLGARPAKSAAPSDGEANQLLSWLVSSFPKITSP